MNMKMLRGFTLIELMIVVVVIGVIAAIAIPAYQGYVERARRADAKAALLAIQLEQEKYRANNPSYANNGELNFPSESPDEFYSIRIDDDSVSSTSYTATATPINQQSSDTCGKLSVVVNESGEEYTADGGDKNCWQR